MKNISIILGCGFGDEGKGMMVNHLCKSKNGKSLVIRFNGGHQAGHTVVLEAGARHVFSSFGSGTLQKADTYWSKYCTVYPPGFLREWDQLKELGYNPAIYIDAMCPVTTPFDVYLNQDYEESLENDRHGSCGVGFGNTIERHETLLYSYRIFAKDLKYEWILREKLLQLAKFYRFSNIQKVAIEKFIDDSFEFTKHVEIVSEKDFFLFEYPRYSNIIFEGAQGILLDRDHGIFPHVTRSHTTSKNAWEIIQRNGLCNSNIVSGGIINGKDITIYYVTRCYQTRHGAGPLLGEEFDFELDNTENETNKLGKYQGEFRKAPFSFELFRYAREADVQYHPANILGIEKKIVFTCLDQFNKEIPIVGNGEMKWISKKKFLSVFEFPIIECDSPIGPEILHEEAVEELSDLLYA